MTALDVARAECGEASLPLADGYRLYEVRVLHPEALRSST
jgi:hypothetical protein